MSVARRRPCRLLRVDVEQPFIDIDDTPFGCFAAAATLPVSMLLLSADIFAAIDAIISLRYDIIFAMSFRHAAFRCHIFITPPRYAAAITIFATPMLFTPALMPPLMPCRCFSLPFSSSMPLMILRRATLRFTLSFSRFRASLLCR